MASSSSFSGSAPTSLTSTINLRDGVKIPCIGLGVWDHKRVDGVEHNECYQSVRKALDLGYRHIDTAAGYHNEDAVGEAIRDSGIPREEIFVTTKIWETNISYERALADFQRSLDALQLSYVDLFLLHQPGEGHYEHAWRALEKFKADGKAKAIGVSNFGVRDLDHLAAHSTEQPSVNQIEIHPYLTRPILAKTCKDRGIVIEAFSPLAQAKRFDDDKLLSMAREVGKTPAQVLIRWSLQKGYVVLPKSSNPKRIEENMNVFDFELSPEQLARMDSFDEKFTASGLGLRYHQMEPY